MWARGRTAGPRRTSATSHVFTGWRWKSTSQARGIKQEALTDTHIADYLQAYPDFFERHSSLLTKLRLPHVRESGATVD